MSNDTPVPAFSPKNYKDTFQVNIFYLIYILVPTRCSSETESLSVCRVRPYSPPALSSPKLSPTGIEVHVKKHPEHPWTV